MSNLTINRATNVPCDCLGRVEGDFNSLQPQRLRQTAGFVDLSNSFTDFRGDVATKEAELKSLVSMFMNLLSQLSALLSGRDKEKRVQTDVIPDKPTPAVPTPDSHPVRIEGLSEKRNGAKADDIWSGFRQGPDGNCVTVSAIKAAMHKFGQSPTDIYKEVSKTERGYHVVMRDGFRLTLTHEELKQAAQGARFVGKDKGMLKDAQFLFAVSAKRAQMENNDGRAARSFSAAIRSLNDGEDERGAGEGFLRLGLKKHMKRVAVSVLARGQVGMVNRTGHSVAVIGGKEELWGRKGRAPSQGHAVALVD